MTLAYVFHKDWNDHQKAPEKALLVFINLTKNLFHKPLGHMMYLWTEVCKGLVNYLQIGTVVDMGKMIVITISNKLWSFFIAQINNYFKMTSGHHPEVEP